MLLEELLQQNYYRLRDQECKQAVLEFLKSHDSVADKDLLFIKRLTKVAHHILNCDAGALTALVEKLYHFHKEGVAVAQKIFQPESDDSLVQTIEAHLLAHAGTVALYLARQSPEWYELAHADKIAAAEASMDRQPYFARDTYAATAQCCKRAWQATGDEIWLERCYHAELKAMENPSAWKCLQIGAMAAVLARHKNDASWAIHAARCYENAAEAYAGENYERVAKARAREMRNFAHCLRHEPDRLPLHRLGDYLPAAVYP